LQLLIEGKPLEAETRFKQSLAPQGIPLPSYLPERQLAERYLKMIEQSRK
jgi:hypothetical protein